MTYLFAFLFMLLFLVACYAVGYIVGMWIGEYDHLLNFFRGVLLVVALLGVYFLFYAITNTFM